MPRPRRAYTCRGCGAVGVATAPGAKLPTGWLHAIVYGDPDGHGGKRLGSVWACSKECGAVGLVELLDERVKV